jgi:hypothetical protein
MCARGLKFDLVELRHPIDQFGDRFAEPPRDVCFADLGVLHHIVQEGGGQGLGIEVPLAEDVGDGERMRDIGFAGAAELALVGALGELVSRFELGDIVRLEITGQFLKERRGFLHESGGSRD